MHLVYGILRIQACFARILPRDEYMAQNTFQFVMVINLNIWVFKWLCLDIQQTKEYLWL